MDKTGMIWLSVISRQNWASRRIYEEIGIFCECRGIDGGMSLVLGTGYECCGRK